MANKKTHGGARVGSGRKVKQLIPERLKKLRATESEWESFQSLLSKDSRKDFTTLHFALVKHLYEINKLSENDLLSMAQTMHVVIRVAESTKRKMGSCGTVDCPRCEKKSAIKYTVDNRKNITLVCKTADCINWREQ
jgi:hypothetical protein